MKDAKKLAESRGGFFRSPKYTNANAKYLWECHNAHRWRATLSSIKYQLVWCPKCAGNSGEECVRICFEKVFRKKFPRVWADWMRSDSGRSLELDGFNARMGVAFEHQGQQHYRHRGLFHREPGQFQRQLSLDRRKSRLCRRHGIRLVKIPEVGWKFPLERLLPEVIRRCRQLGIRVPSGADRLRIAYAPAFQPSKKADSYLSRLKKMAHKRGGILMNCAWLGWTPKYSVRCKKGHLFLIKPTNLLHGKWCPKCARAGLSKRSGAVWRGVEGEKRRSKITQKGNKKYLQNLKNYARSRNGKLLTKMWPGWRGRLFLECEKCGNRWQTQPAKILRLGRWCPACGRRKAWETRAKRRSPAPA